MLDLLTSGLSVVFAPKMFILIIFAVFLGTLFGARLLYTSPSPRDTR